MSRDLYYFLLPYCFVVRGKTMNIIFNAQGSDAIYVTEDIITLVELFSSKSIEEIECIYRDQLDNLKDIISFLIKKGLICIKKGNDVFPSIDFEYNSPEHIKHLVVEYSLNYNFNDLLLSVNSLLTKFIEIRYIDTSLSDSIQEMSEHMSLLYGSTIKSVQLIVDYKYFKILYKRCKQKEFDIISSIVFYNSPCLRSEIWGHKNIQYIKNEYESVKFSNNDYRNNFIFDLQYFILSHSYNPYYYKRLCVDEYGNLKNCLKNIECFGNVNEGNLLKITCQNNFRELWYASCDKILNIKDSPMRYNMYVTNCLRREDNSFYTII